jgi:HPt (histidine-containing phosphotransfer) domain-containing protein
MFLENGVDDFLPKPIEMQKLAAILDKWIPADKKKDAVLASTNGNGNGHSRKLPAISGLNTRTGLANTGGSFTAYISILSIFYRDASDRIGEIREAAETWDLAKYTTLVHALKSASRSVGAAEIGDLAEELEGAGKSRNMVLIKEKTGLFLDNLQKLTENISAALTQYIVEKKDAKTITLPQLKLDTLKEALQEMDVETADNLMKEYKTMSLDMKTGELITELEQYILLFEYEKAIARIDSVQVLVK